LKETDYNTTLLEAIDVAKISQNYHTSHPFSSLNAIHKISGVHRILDMVMQATRNLSVQNRSEGKV